MVQIQLSNAKVEIGQTAELKVLIFTDQESKIQVAVPMDRLTAVKVGQQLAGNVELALNGGSNGH